MTAVRSLVPSEAENAVLGILLVAVDAIKQVKDMLTPADFLLPENRVIYEAMLALGARGKPVDVRLLGEELHGRMESAGGVGYWAGLSVNAPSAIHLLHYVEMVQRQSQRVRLHEALEQASRLDDPESAIDLLREQLEDVEAIRRRVEWDDRDEAADKLLSWITEEPTEESRGIQTGLPSLDSYMNGMRPRQLIVIGARTGIGKTSLAVTITHHVGVVRRLPVLFFSAEMGKDEIRQKLLSIASNIPWERLDAKELSELEERRVIRCIEDVRAAPVFVVQCDGWTTSQIRRWARIVHVAYPVSLVVADYLQFIHAADKSDSRVNEVAAVARELKEMAVELAVPVLTPAQLNRESEKRPPVSVGAMAPKKKSEPTLADLKESGEIEQTANIVLLLWNEKDSTDDFAPPDAVETVLAKMAKNRMGKRGKFALGFRADRMEFCELGRSSDVPF